MDSNKEPFPLDLEDLRFFNFVIIHSDFNIFS